MIVHVFSISLATLLLALFASHGGDPGEQGKAELRKAASIAKQNGVDAQFLERIIETPEADFVEKAVRINVTNFAYTPDYSGHYNDESVAKVKAFIKANDSLLNAVERKRLVAKEVIVSILWIESRCGTITGTYHVPSVYLSLVLASDPTYINASLDRVINGQQYPQEKIDSIRTVIVRRAERKSSWAIKELKSLEQIDQRQLMDVVHLKGSWAGAFGFSQFIPSSYSSCAVDGNSDRMVDLYSLADAAHSIANYLRKNGWTASPAKQRKAVHHYNNSDAYVDAVFTLAGKISK